MGIGWPEYTLGDLCTFKYGQMPRKTDLCDDGYPVFSGYRIVGYATTYHYEEPEIIVVARGVGGTGDVKMSPPKCFLTNLSIAARVVSSEVDKKFLYYRLAGPGLWELRTGSAQAQITIDRLQRYELQLPAFPSQRKIAAILSAYDDLIENNLRRIKILEEMAQNLYREWFGKFRFPGHEYARFIDSPLGPIPEEWEVKPVLSVAEVTYGFAFKSKQFNTDGIGTPIVRIRDVLAGTSETFSPEEPGKKYAVENGDILVGMDGDFHMGFWIGGRAYLVQRVARFRPGTEIGRYHLFLALQEPIRHFNATITGTTVAHLGDKHIQTIEIAWPSGEIRTQLNRILEPTLDQILNLRVKNEVLRRTRDLLLPKLISGELDVSELDIDTKEQAA